PSGRCAASSSNGRAPSAAFGGTSPVNGGGLEAPRFRGGGFREGLAHPPPLGGGEPGGARGGGRARSGGGEPGRSARGAATGGPRPSGGGGARAGGGRGDRRAGLFRFGRRLGPVRDGRQRGGARSERAAVAVRYRANIRPGGVGPAWLRPPPATSAGRVRRALRSARREWEESRPA